MTARHLRALRGVAAASVATILAATAHTLAGGGAPAPALVVAVATLASPFAVALVGRRVRLWRVAGAVLVSQLLFHTAFAITAGADPATIHGAHAHHVPLTVGADAGLVIPDAAMALAHILAAAGTVVALFGGERMLQALGRGIRSLFARTRGVATLPIVHRVPAAPARLSPAPRVVLSDLSRRGPPAFV